MQLENFVNVMGINVIQVIDQIQGDKEDNQKKYLDTDRYFNKDWYTIHCRKQKSVTKEEEERESKLQTSEYFLSNISSGPSQHESQRQLSNIPTSSLAHHNQQQQQHHHYQYQQQNDNKEHSRTSLRETTQDCLMKPLTSPSTTTLSTGVRYRVPSLCKTIDNKEIVFPTTCLTSPPIRTPLPDHVKNFINSNDHNYNKQIQDSTTKTKKTFQDKIRSRIWKRPKSIRWCTNKEFLSKQIKTYRDAYELVQRKNGVVVRMKDKIHLSNEYFDVNSTDRIEFVLFS